MAPFISVFLVVVVVILLASGFYYVRLEHAILSREISGLTAIADLKTNLLEQWYEERMADCATFADTPMLVDSILKAAAGQTTRREYEGLRAWMASICKNYGYMGMAVTDDNGIVGVSYGEQADVISPETAAVLRRVAQTRRVEMTRILGAGYRGSACMDFLVPIAGNRTTHSEKSGILLLRIDLASSVFPVVQSWPTSSRTGESVLAAPQGSHVVLFTPAEKGGLVLRTLKRALDSKGWGTAEAIRGMPLSGEAIDYRDKRVLAVAKPVLQGRWLLVAKEDAEEAFEDLRASTARLAFADILLFFLAGAVLAFAWKHQQTVRWRAESAGQALFKAIFEQAGIGIAQVALDGRFLRVNARLCEILGYAAEELLELTVSDVAHPEDLNTAGEDRFQGLLSGRTPALTSEERWIRKDGQVIWIYRSISLLSNPAAKTKYRLCVIEDVSVYRQTNRALEETTRSMETLLGNLPGMAYRCLNDRTWTMTFVSNGVRALTGYHPEDMMNNANVAFGDLIHPEDRDRIWEEVQRALESKKPFQLTYRLCPADGSIKWVWEKGCGIWDENDRLVALEGFISDITERRQAEEELEKNSAFLRIVMDNASDAIFTVDHEGRFTYVNRRTCEIAGYSEEELLGHLFSILVSPQSAEEIAGVLTRILTTEKRGPRLEAEVIRKDGSRAIVAFSGAPLLRDGNVIGAVATAQDIGDQRKAEGRMRLLNTAIEQSHDAVVITDRSGIIQYVNSAFEDMTVYTREEAIGRTPRILKSGEHDATFYEDLWTTILSGEVWTGRITNRRKDGRLFTEESTISPVKDEHGFITSFVAAKRDITQEIEMEKRLENAKKLETIGMITGGVAHEVRNPLFAISTIVQALERKLRGDEDYSEYMTHILDQTGRLGRLMDDLLTLGRPLDEAKFEPVVLQEVLERAVQDLEKVSPGCRGCITQTLPGEPIAVLGMQDKLVQVFVNILQNALSFNPKEDTIDVIMEIEDGSALFACADRGPGIPDDMLPRLFEPFASKRKGGTGLGLAIVRQIVNAHGGTVEVWNNNPPPGAHFEIALPLHVPNG